MNLVVERHRIIITTGQYYPDIAFMEEVLGLRKDGEICFAQRVNAANSNSFAYLEIKKLADFNPNDIRSSIPIIELLLRHLPDSSTGREWEYCWDELNEDSQKKVKEVREKATKFLTYLMEGK